MTLPAKPPPPRRMQKLQATAEATQEKPSDKRNRYSVAAILASAFLNLLGFTMAGPITPALGQHFQLQVGATFGSLTSAYPLGMLIGLFLWPQLSDRIGRKPVITASLLGSGLGLAAQSHAIRANWGLRVFLLTRIFTGSFAGSSPVSKAFLADVGASEGKLPRYLAQRDAAATLAFICGPMLGGILFDARRTLMEGGGDTASLAFVIGVTSAASLAAAALVAFCVKEVPPQKHSQEKMSYSSDAADDDVVVCPLGIRLWTGVATVCLVSFLFNVGDSTFHAFFPSLLRERLGLDTRAIGLAYTVFATISFSVSATLAGKAISKFGPVVTCATGLTGIALGLSGLAVPTTWSLGVLAAAALYYCGVPLYGPTIPTMLLRCVPKHKRGAVMGLDGAINTIARVIAPLAMGELYRRQGPTVAFGCAGVAVFSAAIIALVRRLLVVRKRERGDDNLVVVKEKGT